LTGLPRMTMTFRRSQGFRRLSAVKSSQLRLLLMIKPRQKMTDLQHMVVVDEAPAAREEVGEEEIALLHVQQGDTSLAHREREAAVLRFDQRYVGEGFRAALTTAPHMHLYVIYPVLIGFAAFFLRLGIVNFRKRVLS